MVFKKGRVTYYEDSDDFWAVYSYNKDGRLIYYEDSVGVILEARANQSRT